ncbi:MAG: filamentous hemagglutinin N-terminal domain-containing protein, partial [Methylococcaceae bacterium]
MINNFMTKPMVLSIILVLISTWKVQAEVVIDGSLGGKAQNLSGPIYNIHDGLGQRQGANVFHSFSQFNINSGDHAIFSTSAPTQNILARVTGGQSSLINGKISSSSPANLWLMNPAGWVVGQNAQLNMQGAFHLSSAHSIGLSDGGMFFADPVSNSKLSTATPIDYQFNKGNQATITLEQADLIMPENTDISIVGGDINLKNSTIHAPGGRVALASNSGQGQWHFDETGLIQGTGSGGTIDIVHDSRASLFSPSITNSDIPSENARTSAGTLQITGEQINLKNATIVTDAWNNKNSGDTTLQANRIHLDSSFISNTVQGSKNAGNVSIIASDLIMANGSKIGADTRFSSTGHGGNISLNLKGRLLMNDLSLISTNSLG